ncbi:MAG TPA: carbon monoxide dehydrogenase subunit G [Nocardioidaceae bacterium]
MKVSGTSVLQAPPGEVWRALNDPAVLVQAIPGCQRLEALGGDAYKMTVAAGVGAIKGVYDGEVHLSDHQEPFSFRMRAHGAGAPGTIGAEVLVMLAEEANGGTSLTYDADAVVGGTIGGVGQRMLTGVSKKMADEFFGNVQRLLAGLPPAAGLSTADGLRTAAGLREEGAPPNQATSFVGGPPGPSTVGAPSSLRPAPEAGAGSVQRTAPPAGAVFMAPPKPPASAAQAGFVAGVMAGAAAALAGVVVGAWIAGRRRR